MPEFLQIVITKKACDTFHVLWQDGTSIVRSEHPDYVDAQAMIIDALADLDFKETADYRERIGGR